MTLFATQICLQDFRMVSTNQFNSGDMIYFTLDLNAKYALILHYVLTKTIVI